MELRLQFNRILLMQLMAVCTSQENIVENTFQILDPGQTIQGKIVAELMTRSELYCSTRFARVSNGLKQLNIDSLLAH